MGISARILQELVMQDVETEMIMIDATHLKTRRTASSLRKKRGAKRLIGQMRTGGRIDRGDQFAPERGGMNSKLHVVCDSRRRPIRMYLSAGQTSDYVGAAGLLRLIPRMKCLLADRGYDSDRFRNALIDRNITPRIPSKKNLKVPIPMTLPSTKSATRSKTCVAG